MLFSDTKNINIITQYLDEFELYVHTEINDIKLKKEVKNKNFFELEDKILKIAAEIQKQRTEDLMVFGEIMIVCEKLSDGYTDDQIVVKSQDPKINYIAKTVNTMSLKIDKAVNEIANKLNEYEEQNYLNRVDTELFRGGSLKDLLIGINSLSDKITEMLSENFRYALVCEKESKFLFDESFKLSESSMVQAVTIEETAASIEEITSNISQNRITAQNMSVYGEKVNTSSKKSVTYVNETLSSMENISNATDKAFEAISVISQIAFQTNILSLNAAVEAATAGEEGKGFAVVAQEVRTLANKSADAAKLIEDLMKDLVSKTHTGKENSELLVKEYEVLNKNITSTIDLITVVENASSEQEKGIKQINDAVAKIDTFTQENAVIAETVNKIASDNLKFSKATVEKMSHIKFLGKEEINIRAKNETFKGKEKREFI